jgi:hypothetical protein
MSTPLAFHLAVDTEVPDPLGAYDPDQQQFIWEGDNEVALAVTGYPLCSYPHGGTRCGCYTTSTACYYRYTCSAGEQGYYCDYN